MNDKNHFLYFSLASVLFSVLTISAFVLTDVNKKEQAHGVNSYAEGSGSETKKVGSVITGIDPQLVTASSAILYSPPSNVVDGNPQTSWNISTSATPATPQWVQIELPTTQTISSIRLTVNQSNPGQTLHRIFIGKTAQDLVEAGTLQGTTKNDDILDLSFSTSFTGKIVRVVTEDSSGLLTGWKEIQLYQ